MATRSRPRNAFGQEVHAFSIQTGITLKDLAKMANVTWTFDKEPRESWIQTISRYERC